MVSAQFWKHITPQELMAMIVLGAILAFIAICIWGVFDRWNENAALEIFDPDPDDEDGGEW